MDRKSIFIIAIATLLTIVGWVAADVLHARSNVEIPHNIQQATAPLDPNFDTQTIKLLP
ncbi:MAG: hypothetical protein Q7R49_00955 [Candidatus Daviesbacteria bacterium]|nr:hypothetical protein [Candidatus Daviesbacteria bacterium]